MIACIPLSSLWPCTASRKKKEGGIGNTWRPPSCVGLIYSPTDERSLPRGCGAVCDRDLAQLHTEDVEIGRWGMVEGERISFTSSQRDRGCTSGNVINLCFRECFSQCKTAQGHGCTVWPPHQTDEGQSATDGGFLPLPRAYAPFVTGPHPPAHTHIYTHRHTHAHSYP